MASVQDILSRGVVLNLSYFESRRVILMPFYSIQKTLLPERATAGGRFGHRFPFLGYKRMS
jgi:hypothetical protein